MTKSEEEGKETDSSNDIIERMTGNKGSINLRKGLIYHVYKPFSNDLSAHILCPLFMCIHFCSF
jgi:hypothetical protein